MKTWVILRGPDISRLSKEADELVERYRSGKGIVMKCSVGDVHIDDVPNRSVTIMILQDDTYATHIIDEGKTRYMALVVGLASEGQALRMSQGMQELGSVAIMSKGGHRTIPEGLNPEDCFTVIIDYPTADAEVRSITFDSDSYFGWVPSHKLSGKRLGV